MPHDALDNPGGDSGLIGEGGALATERLEVNDHAGRVAIGNACPFKVGTKHPRSAVRGEVKDTPIPSRWRAGSRVPSRAGHLPPVRAAMGELDQPPEFVDPEYSAIMDFLKDLPAYYCNWQDRLINSTNVCTRDPSG